MTDPTAPGAPRGDSPLPLTRRELRQRRDAAAIAAASGAHLEPPFDPQPGTGSVDHTPAHGGAAFGSLAGMFTESEAQVSAQPTVLTVCTGNICRSPLAETLLRTRLAGLDLRVHSAGTHGLVGEAMTEPAQRLARTHGVEPTQASAHRARLLTEPLLDDADLILTMTAEQRDYAVRMLPRRLHRIFPVREFARLAQSLDDTEVRRIADTAGTDPRARLVAVVEAIAALRGGASPHREGEDVIDPYRRPFTVYEESAAQLLPALHDVERVVRAAVR